MTILGPWPWLYVVPAFWLGVALVGVLVRLIERDER